MGWTVYYFLVYAIIGVIFTYEAGWIKWPLPKWLEDGAYGRGSWPWLIIFGAYLIVSPIILILSRY